MIPKTVLERLHRSAGSEVTLDVHGETMVVRRVITDYPDWRSMRGMAREAKA